MNSKKFQVAVLALSMVILLSACRLEQRVVPWANDVEPQFVCPGDNVTLSWNQGVEDTGVIVSVSSDPAEVLGFILGGRSPGEHVAGPISVDTSFTFSASGGLLTDRRDPVTHDVHVVLPERETLVPLAFAATCSGSGTAFRDANLSVPEFRAAGVRLVRVCNTASRQITLTLTFESATRMWTLVPGQCTEDLSPELGRTVLGAHLEAAGLLGPPASCDTSSSLPPDQQLGAVLVCDMMSASAPIVIAEPETPTVEPTESGIFLLPTFTPTATPTATPTPGLPMLVLIQNANCRKGPGTVYSVVTSFLKGQILQVDGRNDQVPWWWWVLMPNSNQHCWISISAGTPSGDPNSLPVIQAPPTPVPTEIDFDKDGYGASVDCNDKNAAIHPGAVELLNDNVDSNCNGNINK